MDIPMVPVTSSNLAAVGFDAETRTLRVRFTSGATWEYADVPADKHRELMESESKGAYFAQHIRPVYTDAHQVEPSHRRPAGATHAPAQDGE